MIVAHEEIGRKFADTKEAAILVALDTIGKRFTARQVNVTAAYETAKGFKVIVRIGGQA